MSYFILAVSFLLLCTCYCVCVIFISVDYSLVEIYCLLVITLCLHETSEYLTLGIYVTGLGLLFFEKKREKTRQC